MTKLFNWKLDFSVLIDCSEEDTRFYNNYTTVIDGKNVIIGIAQQCSLGAWSTICNDGTNTNNVADILCRSFGFEGKLWSEKNL